MADECFQCRQGTIDYSAWWTFYITAGAEQKEKCNACKAVK